MSEKKDVREFKVKNMKRGLHEVRGGERLELWLQYARIQNEDPEHHDWMKSSLPFLQLHSWSIDDPKRPKCTFSYTVPKENQNAMGNMHGGCIATLFDFCTTMPVCLINSPDFWWYLGVSRTINTTYLKPIPVGELIFIECELVSIGKTMATIQGVMRRQSDGAVLALCEHGKFNSDPPPRSKI